MTATNVPTALFARITVCCASLVLLLGLLTLIGWAFGMSQLASFRDTYIPMAPSTALCFLCVGVGLVAAHFSQRWLPRLLSLIVLVAAAAKLLEVIVGLHFGIDERLVQDPAAFGAVHTGRMSPIAAFNFVLIATGIILLTDVRSARMAGPLAALTALIGGVVLLGYAYGTPLLYGGTIIPVALTTALATLLSAVALLDAAGPEAWPLRMFRENSTRALLLRSFLPTVVAITLVNGWVRATFFSHSAINPAVSSAIAAIFFALLMTWIVSQVSTTVGGRIDAAEAARNRAQAELQALNSHLEQLVAERTQELHNKNSQMKEELEMARELQFALLPQKFPSIPTDVAVKDSAVRFLSYYFPTGDVSGDFFSIFSLTEKTVGIFICDVMGHGVRAALVTSMIRALVEECGHEALDPGILLARINQGLVAILKQAGTTMYATACYVVVDVEKRELRYATAGHPRPLLVNRGNQRADSLPAAVNSGPALGIFPTAEYGMERRPIVEGDLIMMFTDGLFEVENSEGNMFDEQLLLDTVRASMALPAGEFFDEIINKVRAYSAHQGFDDDVCLIGIEVQSLEPTKVSADA